MHIIKTTLLVIFIGIVTLFTLQNLEAVRFSFLTWYIEIPLSIVSVLFYILGALSGGLLFSMIKHLLTTNNTQKDENSLEKNL